MYAGSPALPDLYSHRVTGGRIKRDNAMGHVQLYIVERPKKTQPRQNSKLTGFVWQYLLPTITNANHFNDIQMLHTTGQSAVQVADVRLLTHCNLYLHFKGK